VIGVVPQDFRFPNTDTSLWVPAAYSPPELANTNAYNYYAVARLRPGVDLGAAQAELDSVALAMQTERPNGAGQSKFTVARLQEHLGRDVRPTFYMLVAAVATILLITCANVANLLLARGTQRNKELAVRKAIGAVGRRLLRQLLTESAVLAAGGVLLGVALSTLAFAYLARLVPRTFPIGSGLAIDWRVLAFAIALSVVTVLLFGAGPALIASRRGFNAARERRERRAALGPHAQRARDRGDHAHRCAARGGGAAAAQLRRGACGRSRLQGRAPAARRDATRTVEVRQDRGP
jgi:uncharacterized membrane protein